ncbi:MAG: S8 family serine peptidase [Flavobacteriaceae bacterium]
MKKNTLFIVILSMLFTASSLVAQTSSERQEIIANYNLENLRQLEQDFELNFYAERQKALDAGWDEYIEMPNGEMALLVGILDSGEPLYYATTNREGGITTRTNKVHSGGGAGLDLNGENMVGGIWDGGRVRATHILLENRVTQIDNPADISNHATHVSGTMIGTGTVNSGILKGMAPEAELLAYDFFNDISEVTAAAANGLLVSNHSYGLIIENLPLWYLGYYDNGARSFDQITYNAPYYLPVVSAGNDRQSGVNPGDGGYDYLTDKGTAKNVLTIAAVFEVLNYTGSGSVTMSSFSSWGPTDDGRIKPDLSAKGINMLSSIGVTDTSIANFSGTSMSSPNVSGSLLLLQQHYNNIYGEFMLSSTLRGLALHTADEAGTSPGPDYRFGWGLLNIEKAAEVISNNGSASLILEEELFDSETFTTTVTADGINDLMASITWTDIAGNILPTGNEDVDTPSLVNDLDIRVSQDGGATFFPWMLDVANYSAPATTGDNIVDNIEKTEIAGASGEYIIQVSHKGSLGNSSQVFSQIITGIDREEFLVSSHDGIVINCASAGSADFDIDLFFNNGFTDTIDFTVSNLPAGTTGSFSQSSLNAAGTTTLTVNNINSLADGDYQFKVTATGTSETINVYLTLRITDNMNFQPTELLTPGNNWQNRPINLTFDWEDGSNLFEEYDFELALDDQFTNMVETQTVTESTTDVTGLSFETEYFWRVRGKNVCEIGPFSAPYRFITMAELGFEDQSIKDLVIFPNPTSTVLNIKASSPITKIEIVNMLGQILISEKATSISEINVMALSTGNYFIRVSSENNTEVLQFLKN